MIKTPEIVNGSCRGETSLRIRLIRGVWLSLDGDGVLESGSLVWVCVCMCACGTISYHQLVKAVIVSTWLG